MKMEERSKIKTTKPQENSMHRASWSCPKKQSPCPSSHAGCQVSNSFTVLAACSLELGRQLTRGIPLRQRTPSRFFCIYHLLQYTKLNTVSVSPLPTCSLSCRTVPFHFLNHSCKLLTHRDAIAHAIGLFTFVCLLRGPAVLSDLNTSIQKIFLWI